MSRCMRGVARCCVVLRGTAWYCVVLRGAAWCCVVLHGAAWCCRCCVVHVVSGAKHLPSRKGRRV